MTVLWKLLWGFLALSCVYDLAVAVHRWNHFGDMYASFATDAVVAFFTFIYVGFIAPAKE